MCAISKYTYSSKKLRKMNITFKEKKQPLTININILHKRLKYTWCKKQTKKNEPQTKLNMHVETLLLDLHLLWDRNNMEYIDISSIGICQVGSSSIRSFPFTSCKFSIKSNNRAWNKATNDKNSYYCDLTENF